MKYPLQQFVKPALRTILVLLVAALGIPRGVRAECKEFKIVEYEDRIEAVCVGEPLTEAQKKTNLEEEKRQEMEDKRKRSEESRRQQEDALAVKLKADAEAAAERKRKATPPPSAQPPANRNTSNNPQILNK
jgi:hypothetical protein